MTKISLYKFITTFCLVPVTDWGAFLQRIGFTLVRAFLFFKLFSLLKQPLFIASLIGLLIWSPDTIAWIFIKIGEIELKVFAMFLTAIMPDLFGTAGDAYSNWAQIWSAGLSGLPADMVQVINGLGVAQILGLITATWTAVSAIKIYRKVMLRAGLL